MTGSGGRREHSFAPSWEAEGVQHSPVSWGDSGEGGRVPRFVLQHGGGRGEGEQEPWASTAEGCP